MDARKARDFSKALYQLVMITWTQCRESGFNFLIKAQGQFALIGALKGVEVSRAAVEQFVCKQSGDAEKSPKSASKIWRTIRGFLHVFSRFFFHLKKV